MTQAQASTSSALSSHLTGVDTMESLADWERFTFMGEIPLRTAVESLDTIPLVQARPTFNDRYMVHTLYWYPFSAHSFIVLSYFPSNRLMLPSFPMLECVHGIPMQTREISILRVQQCHHTSVPRACKYNLSLYGLEKIPISLRQREINFKCEVSYVFDTHIDASFFELTKVLYPVFVTFQQAVF